MRVKEDTLKKSIAKTLLLHVVHVCGWISRNVTLSLWMEHDMIVKGLVERVLSGKGVCFY